MPKLSSALTSSLLACSLLLTPLTAVQAAQPEDPWEGFNRKVFVFNDTVDAYLLRPVAKGYRAITPDPVETGISNVFNNLLEVRNVVNDVLQGKWGQAANDTGRFVVNSTIGLVGVFDVAKSMGMPRSDGEDFGQTFGVWGAGRGPYVVLPFLGPSTVRDTVGLPFNTVVHPLYGVDHVPTRNSIAATELLDKRASLLDAEKLLSGDKYTFIRDAYLQRREFQIHDGMVEDAFGGDDDF